MTNEQLIQDVKEIANSLGLRDNLVAIQVAATIQQTKIIASNQASYTKMLEGVAEMAETIFAPFQPNTNGEGTGGDSKNDTEGDTNDTEGNSKDDTEGDTSTVIVE